MQADLQVPHVIHQVCPRASLPDHSCGHIGYPSLYPANAGDKAQDCFMSVSSVYGYNLK